MKILYICQGGKRKHSLYSDEHEYDMSTIRNTIKGGICQKFTDLDILFPKDIASEEGYIPEDEVAKFDFYISDLTGADINVFYLSGLAEGIGKPIIYISSSKHPLLTIMGNKNILLYSEASIDQEFRIELNKRIKLVKENPTNYIFERKSVRRKKKAFISYTHKNKKYLDRLIVHLKPLEKSGLIEIWKDTNIKTGDDWKNEIDNALSEASIAILLISADFMASDFIIDNELPALLSKAEVKGTKIVPVILSHCRFSREPMLNRFQAVNDPSEPLSTMSDYEKEVIYDKLAQEIETAIDNT